MGCHSSKETPKSLQAAALVVEDSPVASDSIDDNDDSSVVQCQQSMGPILEQAIPTVGRNPNNSFESVGCPWQEVEESFVPIDQTAFAVGTAAMLPPVAGAHPHNQPYVQQSPFELAATSNGGASFEDGSEASSSSEQEGDPLITKPGLEHVLALLERLVGARALLVDLRHPPAAYLRDSQGLRRGDPTDVRSLAHYQEVSLPGNVSGTLGAATPAANPTALLLLTQMAGVVARELGVSGRPPLQPSLPLQQQQSLSQQLHMGRAMSLATVLPAMSLITQRAASFEGGTQLGSLLVDATNGAWRILEVETALVTGTDMAAEEWVGALVWDVLRPPFGNASAAWSAVNEVAALAGDLIVTAVALPSCASQIGAAAAGGLALQCTPASEMALQAARLTEWQASVAAAERGGSDHRLLYLVTLVRGAHRDRSDGSRAAFHTDSSCAMLPSGLGVCSASREFGESPLGMIPVPGVELGELLGKGSYGRVFRGTWHGEEVAVKICHQGLARSGERKVKPWAGVEAVTSLQLRHRHVMRTLKHTTVVVPVAPAWPSSKSASINDLMGHALCRSSPEFGRLPLPSVKAPSAGPLAPTAHAATTSTVATAAAASDHGGSPRVQLLPSVPRPPSQLPFPIEAAATSAAAAGQPGDHQSSPAIASVAAVALGHISRAGGGLLPCGHSRPDFAAPTGLSLHSAALRGGAIPHAADYPLLQQTSSVLSNFGAASLGGSTVTTTAGSDMQAEIDTYVVMEYCNRGSLQRALEDGMFSFGDPHSGSSDIDGQLQQQQARGQQKEVLPRRPDMLSILTAGCQLASALAYMHSRGVIHGDLSRANVLLQESSDSSCGFDVKVADFGMARQLESGSRIDTMSCGTITHSAPELMDEGRLSPAVDVFAIGVLLWELYNGRGAWTGMNQAQVISAVLIHSKRPRFGSDTPRDFAALSNECMSSNPNSRPTCLQVEARLAAMIERLGGS